MSERGNFATKLQEKATEGREAKDSLGRHDTKKSPLMLRVVSQNMGEQWLMEGGLRGGWSDGNGTEFFIRYEGVLVYEGYDVFGWWKIRVKGTGMLPAEQYIALGTLQVVCLTDAQNRDEPVKITSVQIERMKVMIINQDGEIIEMGAEQ